MKYYQRQIIKREVINRFGKLGYIAHTQYVKTNDIEKFNKGKKIKFTEIKRPAILLHARVDSIIDVTHEITSSEAFFRKAITIMRK